MHLAAALRKPGVALFGPTDPERNGPYGDSLVVLRDSSAETTYKRAPTIDPALLALTPEVVAAALSKRLREAAAVPPQPAPERFCAQGGTAGEPLP
jgi:heptosyltransferase-1